MGARRRLTRAGILLQGSGVAVTFVPAAQTTPLAFEYSARSTAIGWVDVTIAPKRSSVSSGT